MKNLLSATVILLSSFVVFCSAQQPSVRIKVTNPSDFSRQGETISVNWTELARFLPKDSKSMLVKEESSGRELLSQLFDSNLDGKPEELLFQADFAPKQTKVFSVSGSGQPEKEVTSLVDARFVEPRQDLAWENDRIAFRMYGPALAAEVDNGIDVWTKRVRSLIVKKWYDGEEQTPKVVYHIDHGEGADFFNVGRSLGCGGSGIWFHDKVYQPGVFSSYKIISTGPIRACFELTYDRWNVDRRKFKEAKRISLDAGQNLNHIEVTFRDVQYSEPTTVACGLVKRPNTKWYKSDERRWMSLWGPTNDSLANGYLGTGVVFASKGLVLWAEDSSQYLALGKTNGGSTFSYYAGAGWTRSGDFANVEDWNRYLDTFVARVRNPLLIGVSGPR